MATGYDGVMLNRKVIYLLYPGVGHKARLRDTALEERIRLSQKIRKASLRCSRQSAHPMAHVYLGSVRSERAIWAGEAQAFASGLSELLLVDQG